MNIFKRAEKKPVDPMILRYVFDVKEQNERFSNLDIEPKVDRSSIPLETQIANINNSIKTRERLRNRRGRIPDYPPD
jgi:hypothetical protein